MSFEVSITFFTTLFKQWVCQTSESVHSFYGATFEIYFSCVLSLTGRLCLNYTMLGRILLLSNLHLDSAKYFTEDRLRYRFDVSNVAENVKCHTPLL